MSKIYIGTSSWADRSLVESGLFYPPDVKTAGERLRYYSGKFPIAEIDSSYHFFPTRQNLSLWLDNTPPDFIFDVREAVKGACHILKPGGVLLATVSGISQISRYDMDRWGDYWRFTTASVEKLFGPLFKGGLEIESFGNVLAAIAFLQGVVVEDLPEAALLKDNDPDYQLLITVVARKGP